MTTNVLSLLTSISGSSIFKTIHLGPVASATQRGGPAKFCGGQARWIEHLPSPVFSENFCGKRDPAKK